MQRELPPRHSTTLCLGALLLTALGCSSDNRTGSSSPGARLPPTDRVQLSPVDKVDLLFMIGNSPSMADKQQILALAVPDLVSRLIHPLCGTLDEAGTFTRLPRAQQPDLGQPCPGGTSPEFRAVTDIHIGIVSSSLGGHGADVCDPARDTTTKHPDDKGRLLARGRLEPVATYQDQGFFAWDPAHKYSPPGEDKLDSLLNSLGEATVGLNQEGCGYPASLEAWYRFLIDPSPPASVAIEGGNFYRQTPEGITFASVVIDGVDEVLLQQRADFLRPDSLVAVINLSDENDCSIIDGTLSKDVCDDPAFDDHGTPIGCNTQRVGWPVGYLEGNAQDWTRTGEGSSARVTGSPFPYNHFVAQRISEGSTPWRMAPGTEACATDPSSVDCKPACYPGTAGCDALPVAQDDGHLRCWEQKRRFGVDALYPLRRYSDGLTQTKVYDRRGFLVQNPLFDDLPFQAAKKNGTPLNRARAAIRPSPLVFYASIVGVPWQDIARNKDDLTEGYQPATSIDWSLILGKPYNLEGAPIPPTDPLMHESRESRTGTHPVTGETLGLDGWNSINGHEYETGAARLQHACIFTLPTARDCASGAGSCDCTAQDGGEAPDQNPLCEKRGVDGQGDGVRSTTQYSAKAYPGTRFLQVAKDVGANAIVSSICTPNMTDPDAEDFGYRPAVAALVERFKTQLTARCLPEPAPVDASGAAACLVLEARMPVSEAHDAGAVAACQQCAGVGRKTLDPAIVGLLPEEASAYRCLCEVTQLTGADRLTCQTERNPTLATSDVGGWCYVDPTRETDAERKAAEEKIVGKCERQIRFVQASIDSATLLLSCSSLLLK